MINIQTPFTVQNNDEGKSFIKQLRKMGFRLKVRGRNPNRKQLSIDTGIRHRRLRQDVPLKYATHFSVYSVYKY